MDLIKKVKDIKKSKVYTTIKNKLKEFESYKDKPDKEWFIELCFCILTANSSAELGVKIQKNINEDFIYFSEDELKNKLKELGHRYYNKRAEYIVDARKYAHNIKKIITKLDKNEKREFLVKNIKGIGYKEASHFLRNVGYKDYAIIDRHILRILKDYNYINEIPKTLTKKRYLTIESILKRIGEQTNTNLAELDLILWYLKTGKIIK